MWYLYFVIIVAGNVQNMKHVQYCTGFIFCAFWADEQQNCTDFIFCAFRAMNSNIAQVSYFVHFGRINSNIAQVSNLRISDG